MKTGKRFTCFRLILIKLFFILFFDINKMISFLNNLTNKISTRSSFDNLLKGKLYKSKFFSERNANSFTLFLSFVLRSLNKSLNHKMSVLLGTRKGSLLDNLREKSLSNNLMKLKKSFFDNLKRKSLFNNLRNLSLFDNLIVESFMRFFRGNLTSIENYDKGITLSKSGERPRDFKNDRCNSAFEVFRLNQRI